MDDLFNRNLDSFLRGVCAGLPKLEAAKAKVASSLERYESHCGHALRVADVYLDAPKGKGEVLTRRCLDFFNGQPVPDGRENRRHLKRIAEDKSILRRLMRSFRSQAGAIEPEQISLADLDNLPPEWKLLKEILPRSIPISERRRVAAGSARREDFPCSLVAQHLVLALRRLSGECGRKELEFLLGERYSDLMRLVRNQAPHSFHRTLTVESCRIRKSYFTAIGRPVPGNGIRIPREEFPEPLRSQVERYRRQALSGFGADKELRGLADNFWFQKEAYSEITVRRLLERLQVGMGYIFGGKDDVPEGLSIEDLVKTEAVPVKDKHGCVTEIRFVNKYVEVYYQKQLQRETPSKRVDFDSPTFEQFRVAVAAVAFVNGYGDDIPNFRKGYKTRLDRDTRNNKKSKKKRVFDRGKVDQEIRRLQAEVARIVKHGSFKMDRPGRDLDVHGRVTKILFFVNTVVLRYLGYRQQCLRKCKLGEHIIFHPDKSITFDFPKRITKNKKHIRIRLSMREHGRTHELLLNTLWLYHDEVYPYIRERDGGVKGYFFVKVSPSNGLFKCYEEEEDFYTCFSEWGKIHLRYETFEGAQEENLILHPHFFRGLCVDWLLEFVGLIRDEVATFIGDEPETLKDYINANMILDATRLLTKANMALKAEEDWHDRPRRAAGASARLKEYKKALRAKDGQLEDAWEELKRMRAIVEREKDEKDALARANRDLERRVIILEAAAGLPGQQVTAP